MSDATHLLFLDDSGTKELLAKRDGSNAFCPHGGVSRHFVFAGPFLSTGSAAQLGQAIADLKRETFKTPKVEVKSHWLRRPELKEKHYLAPYGITDKDLEVFVERLYDTIVDADLQLIAAVVDKKHLCEMYERPWYPPAVAYDLVLQRLQLGAPPDRRVRVTIDDMTGATAKGNPYRRNLLLQHDRMKKHGSALRRGLQYTCLDGRLRFVNSADSHIVQVADLVAYNVYRQFRDYPEEWEQADLAELPTYPWLGRIGPKFRCGSNGRIQGYGIIKFPRLRTIRWGYRRAS